MERVNSLNSEIIPKGSIVERICRFLRARHVEFYLVGGYVRDQLLGRPSHDADFVVAGEALRLARKVADRFGGHFFPLDKERDTGRAILRDEEGEPFFVDFARLRGEDIVADLALRDFTIDAIALDLSDPVGPRLIDPYDGCDDLRAGLVRAVSEEAFRDDPLRTLRAVRLAAELGMAIEPHTEALLREAAPLISRVSAERVRDELIERIKAVPDHRGRPMNTRVVRPEDVYTGPYVKDAPDLQVYMDDLNWRLGQDIGHEELYTFDTEIGPDDSVHDYCGMIAARAPGDSRLALGDPSHLMDVAPTVLDLLGEEIPDHMEGRSLLQ